MYIVPIVVVYIVPVTILNASRVVDMTVKSYKSTGGGFRKAADRSGIEFPKGQKTYILRHTFASHFMMNGGSDCYRESGSSKSTGLIL
jgi:site-specific recombinase XerD